MYFKIVSRHSNMQHDGDLLRSDLYYTSASKELVDKLLDVIKADYKMSFNDGENFIIKSLECLCYQITKVECEEVFDLSRG